MKYKVCIVDEDGERTEQGVFEKKEDAFALRKELILKGFDYVGVFEVKP